MNTTAWSLGIGYTIRLHEACAPTVLHCVPGQERIHILLWTSPSGSKSRMWTFNYLWTYAHRPCHPCGTRCAVPLFMDPRLKEEGEFRYLEAGDGQVLILLHGLFGALSNFGPLFEHFTAKYRVVVPILPLYSLPMLNTNVDNLARFLDRFIRHKGFKEVNIIGNSLGGHVALVYCSREPGIIRTLSLTGSSGLYENAFGGGFPRREDKEFIRKKVAVTFFDPKHATDELVEECYETINDKGKLIRILSLAKSAIRHNMAHEIPKMTMPVLLIWGRQDLITPPHVAEEFHGLFPNSELHWLDECGHAPMMEHPAQFNTILEKWLEKTLS